MIKHTPQEIADFFGCYVAKRDNLSLWTLYLEEPVLKGGGWEGPSFTIKGDLHSSLVNVPADHDWMHLYEPNPDNESEANLADSPKANNKEYIMVVSADVAELSANVSEMMNEGWIPIEDPGYAKLIDESACWYQAMVRGV